MIYDFIWPHILKFLDPSLNGEEDVEEEDDKEMGISWVWDDEDSRTFILIKIKLINISIYCTEVLWKLKYKKLEI
jgi:hypothetical protein